VGNASVKVKAGELRYENTTWRKKKQWETWERVGMRPSMDYDDLILRWVNVKVPDLDFKGAVESIKIDRTIEGASTVTVILRDPNGRIFSRQANRVRGSLKGKYKKRPKDVDEAWEPIDIPNLIGRAVELELDNVIFRLTKVSYDHKAEQLTLLFEDRIVYWLRKKRGQKHASRSQVTRAEFILALLREVKEEKVPFICPALHDKQKIAEFEGDQGSPG
jgi:hypothetical protein